MKKVLCLLLAVLCMFSMAACAGQSEEEERIERVVTRMLTCPDEKLKTVLEETPVYLGAGVDPEDAEEMLAKREQAEKEYAEYLKTDVFTAEDMTEEYQDSFCSRLYPLTNFPSFCIGAEATISVKSITVEMASEDSRTYGYTAELLITKNGEEIPFTQAGKVQLSEDGRISWIDTYVFNDLTTVLQQLT